MDYIVYLPWVITKQARINLVFSLFFYAGIHQSDAGTCSIKLEEGVKPCFDEDLTIGKFAESVEECCGEMGGYSFKKWLVDNHWECSVCQEVYGEHKWLPAPPCDRKNCGHVPQHYVWFSLTVPNRQIHCMGRSFKDILDCRSNKTLCSYAEPATDPVFCFKHRYRQFNTSSFGCPASSLDWELARDKQECCATKGRAGYARHINKWYIDEAKLHTCEPCENNPSADITWSEWTACAQEKKCTRKRFLQIPYTDYMPKHWCVETVQQELPETCTETDRWIIWTVAFVGSVIIILMAGVIRFLFLRRWPQAAPPLPPTKTDLPKTKYNENDGYLVPIRTYNDTPRMPRLTLPDVPEDHTYEGIDYYHLSMNRETSDRPFSPNPPEYIELK